MTKIHIIHVSAWAVIYISSNCVTVTYLHRLLKGQEYTNA
jgi:hypothetical protein